MAEQRRPGTFAALWLYEPIVHPRGEGFPGGRNPLADGARRRRPWFPDREAALTNFGAKPPLNTLVPKALEAYVDHGLRRAPGSDAVELKCTPEVEALVFEAGMRQDTFAHLDEVDIPVTVAASGDGSGAARLAPVVAAALPQGRLEPHPELSHFGPMEDPAGIAAAIAATLWLA
jgi:hypothetical protein